MRITISRVLMLSLVLFIVLFGAGGLRRGVEAGKWGRRRGGGDVDRSGPGHSNLHCRDYRLRSGGCGST